MNLTHLKYAVEIAATGSINKAAEKLYVGQPNLSRALKELESSLGVSIFERSAKGMELTPDGQVFIDYAKSILNQVDSLEELFKKDDSHKKFFSVAAPDSGYILQALGGFSRQTEDGTNAQLVYCEQSDPSDTVKSILRRECNLGIIRYNEKYDKYYKSMLDGKDINYELLAEFKSVVLFNRQSSLSGCASIAKSALKDFTEISGLEEFHGALPARGVRKYGLPAPGRQMFCKSLLGRLELLSSDPRTYALSEPCTKRLLERFGLCGAELQDAPDRYRDFLIYHKSYKLSELDSMFISELCMAKRDTFN